MLIEEIKDIPEKEVKNFLIDEGEIFQTLVFLKENGFHFLMDIFAVDYPNQKERHEVIYLLLSIKLNKRLALKVKIREGRSLPSSVEIFKTAGWLEREVFDMYGIKFSNNPDLRRILTDYNFEGHPMLKDFPLSGYKEVRYDVEARKVVYDNVNLAQDYRSFNFLSPWEGTMYKKN